MTGFFASLFDVSFNSLITTRIIKVVYVLFIVLDGLTALFFIVGGFQAGPTAGVLILLVGAPLASLGYLVFVRVFLEAMIAVFRIMENTQALAHSGTEAPTSAAN